MIENLISVEEFVALRHLSKKIDREKIEQAIMLAQESDLQDSLGEFYYDLLDNFENPEYQLLMNGGRFTDDGENLMHFGIKKWLADLVYARYILMLNINLTPFGAQNKYTEDSNNVDRLTLRDESKQAQIDAGIKFKMIRRYLLSNDVLFKRFCDGNRIESGYKGLRISNLENKRGCESDVLSRRYKL